MHLPTPRLLAVQAVTLASAACSAAYYGAQAPAHTLDIAGHAVHPWVLAIAATAFALDATKPLMLATAAAPSAGIARRIAAATVFAVLFISSMVAIDGMLMRLRSDWSAGRDRDASAYADARAERDRLAAELSRIADARTTSEVRADMDRVRISPRVFEATRQCTDDELLRGPANAAACKPLLDLRLEMAQAIRKADVERQLATQRAKVSSMELAEPPRSADPQAAAIARALGQPEPVVAYAMILVVGLALELVACLGVWIGTVPRAGGTAAEPAPGQFRIAGTAGTGGPTSGSTSSSPAQAGAHASLPHGTAGSILSLPAPSASRDPVTAWVHEFRARNGRNPQIPELQAEFHLPKTTAWRRIRSA